jgi:hypothetical protein
MGQWIQDLATQRKAFADRQSVTIPSEDPDYGGLGRAFPEWHRPDRDAILQPPKPAITPSARVMERAMERESDFEAAD